MKGLTEKGFLFLKIFFFFRIIIINNKITQIEIYDIGTQPFTTWRNFVKDVNVQKDRVDPSKGQNCFWQKLSKVWRFHDWAISLFLNTLEIVLCYLFKHQLTRSRKVLSIIQTELQNLLPFLKIYSLHSL